MQSLCISSLPGACSSVCSNTTQIFCGEQGRWTDTKSHYAQRLLPAFCSRNFSEVAEENGEDNRTVVLGSNPGQVSLLPSMCTFSLSYLPMGWFLMASPNQFIEITPTYRKINKPKRNYPNFLLPYSPQNPSYFSSL